MRVHSEMDRFLPGTESSMMRRMNTNMLEIDVSAEFYSALM